VRLDSAALRRSVLEFGVLGFLTVLSDGGDVEVSGAVRRAVLVRLLMAGGQPLSASQLAHDAWDGAPPKAASRTLQTNVSFLRKAIPGFAIRHVGAGYVLDTTEAALDSVLFEQNVREALANQGDPEKAEAIWGRALGRWRGPALADVAGASWALGERARLEQLRMVALESWLMTLVETGRAGDAVAEAQAAVEADPLRDGLWSAPMMALYRSGWRADALRAYQKLRLVLTEAGLEPSAEFAALENAIALGDPNLPGADARSTPSFGGGLSEKAQQRTSIAPSLQMQLPSGEVSCAVPRDIRVAPV
jgi:DNA-binding SARP family transcriptional activator